MPRTASGPYERYFTEGDPSYRFVCYAATSHSVTIGVRRFADAAAAQAQFEAEKPLVPVDESDGFAAVDWQEQDPSFPGGREEHRLCLMQAGAWLVRIHSFDDTDYLIAPDPRKASLDVFAAIRKVGLLPPPEVSP
jgi:hypothetical protein